jgi:hypothetical protein
MHARGCREAVYLFVLEVKGPAIILQCVNPEVARRTRSLGRPAGPIIGVLLPRSPVERNDAIDPLRTPALRRSNQDRVDLFEGAILARDDGGDHYSITSSARSTNDSGIVRPMAFAVLRFTANSNLVGS